MGGVCFNPRALRGARHGAANQALNVLIVSIHAPGLLEYEGKWAFQSTRPARGATLRHW